MDLTSSGSGSEHKFITGNTKLVAFNPTGTTIDQDFVYKPTAPELNSLTHGIKKWTESELLNAFGVGLIKDVTDTVPVNKDPNVVGNNVTLLTHDSVGQSGGSRLVNLAVQPMGEDDRVALAAAERLDVQYLSAAPVTSTANFSGFTITRTGGDSWSGFSAGMYITIEGANGQHTQNETNANVFYKITAVSGDVDHNTLTVDRSLTTEFAKSVSVAPVVLDPVFQAQGGPFSVAVHFIANGFDNNTFSPTPGQIVRDDGVSWLSQGFDVDQLVRLDHSLDNTTTGGLAYRITDVTASTLTLSQSDVIQDEADHTSPVSINITRGVPASSVAYIKVEQINAFKVNALGTIDITAGKNVFLNSDLAIRIDQVSAGDTVTGDKIRIKGDSSILDAVGGGTINVRGNDMVLEASNGAIGQKDISNDNPLKIDSVGGGTLTARAAGVVNIYEKAGAGPGNMNIESVFAAGDNAYLKADGSIFDALNNEFTKVRADDIVLTALGGTIGNVVLGTPNFLDVDASGTLDATAHGSIWISQTTLDMHVHQVLSQTGDVDLKAASSILDQAGDVTDIFGNNITLKAEAGGIGAHGNALDIFSHYSGPGTLTATALGDLLDIVIIQKDEIAGTHTNDLYLNTVSTGAHTVAFITAPIGSILNGNPGGQNVLGGNTFLSARDDIGKQSNRIASTVGNIEAQSTTGSTWIDNQGDLSVGGSFTTNPQGIFAGGSATITASSPITVKKSALVGGSLQYIATDDSSGDDLVVEAVDLNGQPLYLKATGDIRLLAGDNLTVEHGALLQAGGSIVLKGDVHSDTSGNTLPGDTDPGLGSTIAVAGTLMAPVIEIDGGPDADVIQTTTGTLTAAFPWTAVNWPFAPVGVSFPASPSTASQITINGNGGNDQISLWGDVSARETDINGGDGSDVITLNPDNTHGYALAITGRVVIKGGAGEDDITVNRLNTLDFAHKGSASRDTVDIDGEGGTDNVVVNVRSGRTDYVINVTDTGAPGDGADTLTINGTETGDPNDATGADLFLVRRNFVAYLNPDTSVNDLHPELERINYDENINGRLVVNGLSGDDQFYSDDNSSITTLDSGAGNDFFQIGQLFGTDRNAPAVAAGDEISTIFTTKGYLSRGISFPMVVYGGTGDDTFRVYSNQAELRLEGNAGDDSFIIRAFALADPLTGKALKDLSMAAQTAVLGGDGNDLIEYSVNAPTDIDGGTGFNQMVVLGTEFDDNFAISSDGIFGAGLHITYANIQSITVDGLEGNDNFFILSTPPGVAVNVVGGIGYDTFNVGGDVTLPVVSRDLEGLSGVINHRVTSADLDYDNIPADGVPLHVATPSTGQIVVQESSGSTVVNEQGGTTDSFTYSLAATPNADVYITVSAAQSPSEAATAGARTVLVSVDGGATFQPAAVVKFAGGTAVGTTKMVQVKAIDDAAAEGDGLVMVSTSSRSTDSRFNHVAVRNVKVEVLDNDQPGLRITQTDGETVVLEGAVPHGITDSYSLALARAPEAGKTVTVTLSQSDPRLQLSSADTRYDAATHSLTFDSTNWDTAALISVAATDDAIVESPLTAQITHAVASTDTAYASFFADPANPAPTLNVKVLDTDGAGVYVRQSDGSTLVVKGDPTGDTYGIRLTHAPTADVKISLITDGQTLVSNFNGADARFTAATGSTPAFVTFSTTNWFNPFVVKVTADPAAPPPDPNQQLKFFPVQPHIAATAIQGSLTIDGSVGPEDRSVKPAVKLPTETDAPLPNPVASTDDTGSVDTLNIFNDGSGANDVGTLTGSNLFLNGMGGNLHFVDGQGRAHDFTGGVNYLNVETIEVMLGRGNDDLTINDTMATTDGMRGPLTIVHGGGGSDTITINGGGGTASPLIVFGDTSQDGSRYVGLSGVASVNAFAYNNPGNDTIDARNDTQSVTIFGGVGNDTIWGSQAGDHIAGGSGNDTIHGQGGDDIIYGDDGFNVGKSTIVIPDPNEDSGTISRTLYNRVLVTVSDPSAPVADTHDTLTPGQDLIYGDGGNDVVFGDLGLVTQTVPETLLSTLGVVEVESKSNASGGNDTIYGNAGDDILIGGTGNDAIDGGDGKDLIFGDNVSLDRTATLSNFTNPRFRALNLTPIYSTAVGTAGNLLITGTNFTDPGAGGNAAWADFQITIQDHTSTTAAGLYGNDYIAGGAGDDMIFGELGNDVIQGDGSIDVAMTGGQRVYAYRDASNALQINPSFDAATDGIDYIEGGGGNDTIFGNQGQDDIIGGSSSLFSLVTPAQRPDGSDLIFGGSGTAIGRNDAGDTSAQGHANDSDMIVGDNGNIFRIVGTNGTSTGHYLSFNYDNYTNGLPAVQQTKIVVRAAQMLDYTPGGADFKPAVAATDIGAADEIHGEAGDDFLFGMVGNDVLYGDGQNDSIVGGYGADWISGGTGDDGILGDDGLIFSSRNSSALGEPLYGIAAIPASQISLLIQDSNDQINAIINVNGALTYTADLTPDNVDPNTASPNVLFRPKYANDIIYGGLGNDSIHGGAGDDAISGAEAPMLSYTTNYDNATGAQIGTVTESDFSHPFNPGNPLGYNPSTTKFALYDANDSLREVLLTPTGTLSKTGTGLNWILNFDATEGPKDTHWVTGTNGKPTDGDDRIFGDLGNDWAVGGTGRDQIFGGWGDDLLDADDDLTTNGTLNNRTDTDPSYNDLAYGGAGRDVLIGNTGADRLVDWAGEFNTYLVPYSNYGLPTVVRLPNPAIKTFLLQLSKSDGADPTLAAQHGGDPARNGEPFGELGMVVQGDSAWNDQTGGPRDPQAGNLQSKVDTTAWGMPIMQVAAEPARATPLSVTSLTDSQLAPIVVEAKQLWTAALGAADPRLTVLNNVDIQVGNLPDGMLGETTGNSILIDRSAAGWGWFVDPTPQDNSEFSIRLLSGALAADPASAAFGRMDLLTTVSHEMANAMGFAEDYGQDVTGMTLQAGVRALPAGDAHVQVSSSSGAAATPSPYYDSTGPYAFFGAGNAGNTTPAIDWSNAVIGVSEQRKAGQRAPSSAWLGDFLNHLGQSETQRNPNLGIRVHMEAASKVLSTLRGG